VTNNTRDALISAVIGSILVSGCGIATDCNPRRVFGAAVFAAALLFAMDFFK